MLQGVEHSSKFKAEEFGNDNEDMELVSSFRSFSSLAVSKVRTAFRSAALA